MFNPSFYARCATFLLLPFLCHAAGEWTPLLKGNQLTGWDTWLGKPLPAVLIEGEKRNDKGEYLAPLGTNRDPLQVFTISTVEGQPTLHVSGQIFGYAVTKESYHDYHLKLQFKWGQKKWAPRDTVVRDSGLLYHVQGDGGFSGDVWPRSSELQIQEHDCGDLYSIGMAMTVRASAQPDKKWIYDPKGEPMVFLQQKPVENRCIRLADMEKPVGEWNSIELVCLGDTVVYVVNGKVVMRLSGARNEGDLATPITAGRIALQSEGAEVFYRGIEIRSITAIPVEYKE